MQKSMVFEVENCEKWIQNALKKQAFFNIDFSAIFRGFWPRLGKVLGGLGDGFRGVLVRSGSLLGIPLWMHPCWALLGFAGLCLAWFGFAWPGLALLGCAGLCWALLVFAGLCWALLGFAWLS